MKPTVTSYNGEICIRIPMLFRRRGGRKTIILPEAEGDTRTPTPRAENALIRSIVKAHHLKELLESGRYTSITALAKALKVNASLVGRLLNLTLLAPDIVEVILLGNEPEEISIEKLYQVPLDWEEQRKVLRVINS